MITQDYSKPYFAVIRSVHPIDLKFYSTQKLIGKKGIVFFNNAKFIYHSSVFLPIEFPILPKSERYAYKFLMASYDLKELSKKQQLFWEKIFSEI